MQNRSLTRRGALSELSEFGRVDDGDRRGVITPDRTYRVIDETELGFVPKGHAPSRQQQQRHCGTSRDRGSMCEREGSATQAAEREGDDLPTATRTTQGSRRVYPPAP